jgi:hypothetical protein
MLSALIRTVLPVVLLIPVRAWVWGNDGHRIAAVIAADNLTPAAQSYVASVLGVLCDSGDWPSWWGNRCPQYLVESGGAKGMGRCT